MTGAHATLTGAIHGVWEVRTWSALYLINLDNPFPYVVRTPVAVGAEVRRNDGKPILLLSVRRCEVGLPMRLMLDFRLHQVPWATRTTNPVQSIVKAESE